ncbi:MAG: protoporphyrinogen oxidase [Bryobacteraceae bacterium]
MRIAIVGGGISGLSAAYYLARNGIASTIVESRPRLGGVIQTEQVDGCTVEAGPDSFLSAKPAALELIRELGLESEVIGSNDHLRRTYVRRRGRLVPLPDGLMMMVPTRILPMLASPLVGFGTKLRMGLELFRAPKPRAADQSVSEFIGEHYGREAVDYLAEPLLSGVYGGDPAELSVRSVLGRFVELSERYGSLSRGVLAERAKAARAHAVPAPLFRTLKGGLQQMTDAVAAAIAGHADVRCARVETIERGAAGFRLRLEGGWLDADRIVVATEAHSAAGFLMPVDGRLAELLGAVPYSSSMTVALGFDTADFAGPLPDGFGFLVPRVERRRLVACTWVGTKFSHRAPQNKLVARCFLGGRKDSAILDSSDQDVVAIVRDELRDIAGVTARPRFHRISRWPRSMAQYTVGHAARLAEMEARAAATPGLYLAGNAYRGIGIPDCIRMGKAAAEAIRGAKGRAT